MGRLVKWVNGRIMGRSAAFENQWRGALIGNERQCAGNRLNGKTSMCPNMRSCGDGEIGAKWGGRVEGTKCNQSDGEKLLGVILNGEENPRK